MRHEINRLRERYPVPEAFRRQARISGREAFDRLYARSIGDPEGFWSEKARELLSWHAPWGKTLDSDFEKGRAAWFRGGKLNVSYNCLDRHVQSWRRNKAAIIFEGERIGDSRTFTYQDLFYEVNKLAQVLKKLGVQKGDRVTLYLPMIPATGHRHACMRAYRGYPQRGLRWIQRGVSGQPDSGLPVPSSYHQ